MEAKNKALEIGQLALRLAEGYYAYLAAITIAMDTRSDQLIPETISGQHIPIGIVKNKDGSEHQFDYIYYLKQARKDPLIVCELERIWLTGSILRLSDELSKNKYFDRAPELELIRHLRNGIAHGNRFRIDKPENLIAYPAHNKDAWTKNVKLLFEVTPDMDGQPVLFDFMQSGDVVSLFQAIGIYLSRMGNGDTLRMQ